MFKILVVEDDLDLNRLFCKTLTRNAYQAVSATNADEALEILDKEHVDLMITDVMMPGVNGFSLIQQLRQAKYELPILVITAKGDILDKQTGFLSGADDYMVKPIDINEMVFRVNALLRRARSVSEHVVSFGETTLEYNSWSMHDSNGTQILPQKEFQLLYKLLSYPGQIFTRQQLLDDIWGIEQEDSHTLDVHMSRLREKLRTNPDIEIQTIRGLGYRAVKK